MGDMPCTIQGLENHFKKTWEGYDCEGVGDCSFSDIV